MSFKLDQELLINQKSLEHHGLSHNSTILTRYKLQKPLSYIHVLVYDAYSYMLYATFMSLLILF